LRMGNNDACGSREGMVRNDEDEQPLFEHSRKELARLGISVHGYIHERSRAAD